MPVDVHYFADFKDIARKEKDTLVPTEYNLRGLVNLLFEKYPPMRNLIWDDQNQDLKKTISIAINDSIERNQNQLSTSLSEGDKVVFLLPISGG